MAQPARRRRHAEDLPPVDPTAVQRAYRHERAKRRARERRAQERRLAGFRFTAVVFVLLVLSTALAYVVWQQIQRLFGL
jgi:hypothetical protein